MLTVTVRHDVNLPLKLLRKLLLGAWRRCRQRGTVQRIWKEKVHGTIRAIEVTRGAAGWHPHLHLLVLTSEWSESERTALERAYEAAVRREADRAGVVYARVAPKDGVALRWSSARATEKEIDRSGYLAKLGWELTGAGKGDPQWRIAAKAVDDPRAASFWREYTDAMAGVRAIECDERAAAFAQTRAQAMSGEVDALANAPETRVEIGPFRLLRLRDAERVCPTITRDVLVAAARAGPNEWRIEAAFDACLESVLQSNRHVRLGAA